MEVNSCFGNAIYKKYLILSNRFLTQHLDERKVTARRTAKESQEIPIATATRLAIAQTVEFH